MFQREKELSDELDTVKKDLSRLQGDLSSLLSALHTSGKGKLEDAQEVVTGDLAEVFERLRARGHKLVSGTGKEVQKHPVMALAAAVGVGFLIGKLTEK